MPSSATLEPNMAPPFQAERLVHSAPEARVRSEDRPSRRADVLVLRIIGRLLAGLPRSGWVVIDAIPLCAGFYFGYRWFEVWGLTNLPHVGCWSAAAVFSAAVAASGLVFGLYERETLLSRSRILTRMLLTTGLGCVLAYACIYVLMYSSLSRRVVGGAVGGYLILGTAVRMLACWAVHTIKRPVVIVGGTDLYRSFQKSFREGFFANYELVGYVNPFAGPRSHRKVGPHLGRPADLPTICHRYDVADVVVSTEAARHFDVMEWVLSSLRKGCRVANEDAFYEKATGQILVDQITPNWFLFADLKVHCEERATLKTLFDVVIAGLAAVLTLPLWPLIALAIKLGDRGPVLYSQDRVGRDGRGFRLYKFRTMIVNAESGKSLWARRGDPRITRVGRVLRRTRLDELPQLYNILVGDMSVIGPRPERPTIVRELSRRVPYYETRHLIKPGLTGWAQISFRYGSSVDDARRKLQFDLYYLKHMSLELDVIILFRTLGTFLRGAC